MISIIVSSVSPEQNDRFRQNIKQTIGDTPYELLVHDNRETHWGLCKLYNELASKSNYDILCFLHEDILFHTFGWGKILMDFFHKTPKAGVVGFAGATLKTKTFSGWGGYKSTSRINILQCRRARKPRAYNANPEKDEFSPVAITDGMAIIVRKEIWEQNPFDQQTFNGFHLYDLDFSLQIAQRYTNYVCQIIEVEHLSPGSFSEVWHKESLKFHAKWKHILPFSVYPYSKEFIQKCEDYCDFKGTKRELRYGWNGSSLTSIVKERLRLRDLTKNRLYYNIRLIDPFFKSLFKKLLKSRPSYDK